MKKVEFVLTTFCDASDRDFVTMMTFLFPCTYTESTTDELKCIQHIYHRVLVTEEPNSSAAMVLTPEGPIDWGFRKMVNILETILRNDLSRMTILVF